ncbi:MAG: DUF4286 family protein [Ginsengibacter sp.]
MWIYNITTKVENSIEDEWLGWIRGKYIPDVMSTGLFFNHGFMKLYGHDESDGKTYVLQFFADEKNAIDSFNRQHAKRIAINLRSRWGEALVTFETLLQSVQ